jgi:hypothetical protein
MEFRQQLNVEPTNFGFESRQQTLIWREGVVLCVNETFAACIACGTISIGDSFSNDAVFWTNI